MTPRFKPPKLEEQGIQAVFEKRQLNLDLFKLLIKAGQDNTSVAKALSEEYRERMGIDINIAATTVKRYRGLL